MVDDDLLGAIFGFILKLLFQIFVAILWEMVLMLVWAFIEKYFETTRWWSILYLGFAILSGIYITSNLRAQENTSGDLIGILVALFIIIITPMLHRYIKEALEVISKQKRTDERTV